MKRHFALSSRVFLKTVYWAVLSTIKFFKNDNDIYKYIILNIRNMFEYRNLLWYLLFSPTLLQRRSLDNGAGCFRRIGSTSSRGAGDRKTITNGANNDVNGYSGPFGDLQ